MSDIYGTEEYFKKVIELQDRLRKSEEERLKLEMRFNQSVQATREEKQSRLKKLRSQYKRFLEEDQVRQERNEEIVRALEKIEGRAKTLEAKTERFSLLRRQYSGFLTRVSKENDTEERIEKGQLAFKNVDDFMGKKYADLKNQEGRKRFPFTLPSKRDEAPSVRVEDFSTGDWKTPRELENFSTRPYFGDINSQLNSFVERAASDESRKSLPKLPQNNSLVIDSHGINEKLMIGREKHENIPIGNKHADELLPANAREISEPSVAIKIDTLKPDYEELSAEQSVDKIVKNNESQMMQYQIPNKAYQIGKQQNESSHVPIELEMSKYLVEGKAKVIDQYSDELQQSHQYLPNESRQEISQEHGKKIERYENNEQFGQYDETGQLLQYDKYGQLVQNYNNVPMMNYDDNGELIPEQFVESGQMMQQYPVSSEQYLQQYDDQAQQLYENEQLIRYDNENEQLMQNQDENGQQQSDDGQLNQNEEQFKQHQLEETAPIRHEENNHLQINEDEQKKEISKFRQIDELAQQKLEENDQLVQNENRNIQNNGDSKIENAALNQEYETQSSVQNNENEQPIPEKCFEGEQPIEYNEGNQSHSNENEHLIQQYTENEPVHYDGNEQVPYNDNEQLDYPKNGQLLQNQYEEIGQPIQYDENGQSINYDENGLPIYYDESGQPIHFDESGQTIQYDEHGQPIHHDESGQQIHYDESGQPIHYDENGQLIQYDEHGQSIHYDENGQQIHYDGTGQPIHYDENGQPIHYDEHGQPIHYDENGQQIHYDENGQPIYYDENGQPIHYDENKQQIHYDENGQSIHHDESGQQIHYDESGQQIHYDENGQPIQYDQLIEQSAQLTQEQYNEPGQLIQKNEEQPIQYEGNEQAIHKENELIRQPLDENEQENIKHVDNNDGRQSAGEQGEISDAQKINQMEVVSNTLNVLEMLDTDTESVRHDTKTSNESDFDFSN